MFPVQTARFIPASEFFKNCPSAWNEFCESDPDCSWGDNNRTLINPEIILRSLENMDYDIEDIMIERCKELIKQNESGFSDWVYIDLEN